MGEAHTSGVESFWAMLESGFPGNIPQVLGEAA